MLPLLNFDVREAVMDPPFLLYFLPERGTRWHELWTARAEGLNSELRAKGYPVRGGFATAEYFGLVAPNMPDPRVDFALLFNPDPIWIKIDLRRHAHVAGDKTLLVKAMSEQVIDVIGFFKP
jgi:hypothetical protein